MKIIVYILLSSQYSLHHPTRSGILRRKERSFNFLPCTELRPNQSFDPLVTLSASFMELSLSVIICSNIYHKITWVGAGHIYFLCWTDPDFSRHHEPHNDPGSQDAGDHQQEERIRRSKPAVTCQEAAN